MGWWDIEDGSGVVGDRPADLLDRLLRSSLELPLDSDLFAGLLVSVGAALLRNPELLEDPPRAGDLVVAEFERRPPLVIELAPVAHGRGLDDAVYDTLEEVAFAYRAGGPERAPRLAEVLAALAFALRGRLVDADTGAPLDLIRIRGHRRSPAPDWRAPMVALLHGGHVEAEVPPLSVGLRDIDRRALLALRDLAVARARGEAPERPVHPDPEIAAARARLLRDVEAALDGTALPGPDSPAYILRALLDPAAVADAPPEWRAWLSP
jgi:hypothetical protein